MTMMSGVVGTMTTTMTTEEIHRNLDTIHYLLTIPKPNMVIGDEWGGESVSLALVPNLTHELLTALNNIYTRKLSEIR
jgi:hypothetical protein